MHMGNFSAGITKPRLVAYSPRATVPAVMVPRVPGNPFGPAMRFAAPVRSVTPTRYGRPYLGDTTAAKGAISGASTGATVGSAVPVIGTAIGAVVGAVVGALAAILSKKDRDKVAWGTYLANAGKVPGRAYDELPFELAWQGMQEKYNPWKDWSMRSGDSSYEMGLVDLIVQGARSGALTTTSTVTDVAQYVFSQLEAHHAGFFTLLGNQGVRQVHVDFIDRAIAGLPVGATYKNKRQLHTTLLEELQKAGVAVVDPRASSSAPIATSQTVPVAPQGSSPAAPPPPVVVMVPPPTVAPVAVSTPSVTVPTPVTSATAANQATSTIAPAQIVAPGPTSLTPAGSANQTTDATAVALQKTIDSLLASGASQQAAFQGAMDRLSTQGIAITPQVQDAVAKQVVASDTAMSAEWYKNPLVIGGLAVGAFLVFSSMRRRR